MKRGLLCVFALLFLTFAFAQTPLPQNTIVTENFNSIGSGTTASLPANWKMSSAGTGTSSGWTTGTNISATTQAANSGIPANGGAYNWATTAGTDRAIGFFTTASYASPNAIMAYYRNTTGASVSTVSIAYNIERYLVNTGAATVDFFYSTNGTAWTAVSAASTTASDFPAGGSASGSYTSPKTVSRSLTITPAGGVLANGDIYFKWVFNTTASGSQGLGLDNVAVFAGTATPVLSAKLKDILQVDNGVLNQFNEGDVIRYQTILKNTGTGDATGVQVTLPTPPANTTMVGGSIKTSAVAVDDNYAASFNTVLNGTSVLQNDVGIPAPSAVLSFGSSADATTNAPGTTVTTDAGGSLTMQANGSVTYTPPPGFVGTDRIKYITGNGNLPNNDAIVTIIVSGDIVLSTTNTDPFCNNGTNGSITVNATGGNGTLQYSINGSAGPYQASNVFTGLSSGTYNIAVKDAGGYIKTSTATLNNPAAIVVSGSVTTLTYTAAMATATFTKTGGTGATSWSASGLPAGLSLNATTGDLTGTPTVTGAFAVTITATDVNGCTGTKSVTINVAPKLSNDTYGSVVGNTQLVADGHSAPGTPFTASATNILSNDASDAALTVSTVTNAATTAGGTITIDAAGKFIYTPPVGLTGADSYTYTATSNGVSATATISFTIANMIWYVNNTYGGANGASNGSSHRPYTDLAAASTAAQTNQLIYVHTGSGNTAGNATLKSGQTLRGAGSVLSVGALSIAAGTKPTLTGSVILANSVTVDGFDMNTGTVTAISNAGNTVTSVTLSVGTVSTTTGTGIAITGTGNSVTITLQSLSTNGAANAVNLTNTAGTVSINAGTLTGGAGAVINIGGGTVAFTYSGSASQATASQPLVSINGGHTTGTVTFQSGTLSATNGTGLQFDNADGTYNFSGTTTLNGGDAGIDILNGSAGTFSFASSTSITNPTGNGFTIGSATVGSGSTCSVTYNGTISKTTAGRLVDVQQKTGGTVTFAGAICGTTSNTGISLTNNTGATLNFSGGITLNGAGSVFAATGGGTLTVTGANNNIGATTAATATALSIANTTIGSANVTFKSISVNGGASGIDINNTGGVGRLIITGDGNTSVGGNSSGGTIQNTTGHAILLTNTTNPSFTNLNIQNTGGSGMEGSGVNSVTIQNSTINNSGTAGTADDSNIAFNNQAAGTENNLDGTVTITNNILNNARWHGIMIQNFNGTIADAVITGNSITSSTVMTSSLGYGINMQILGSAGTVSNLTKGNISNNTIINFPSGGGIQIQGGNSNAAGPAGTVGQSGNATNVVNITGNLIRGQSAVSRMNTSAILYTVTGKGQGNVNISNNGTAANPLAHTTGTTIGVGANGNTTVTAVTNGNYIESNHPSNGGTGISGGTGVTFGVTDAANLTWTINNNTINNTDGNGILAVARGATGNLKVTIKNNIVEAPMGGVRPGIRVDAGNTTAGSDDAVCLDISGNTSAGSGGSQGIGLRKQGTVPTTHDFGIEGMAATSSPGIESYVNGLNPAGGGTLLISATSGFTNCNTAPRIMNPTTQSNNKPITSNK